MTHHPYRAFVLLIYITLAFSACATRPDVDLTIHESDQGAVYVERIPDRSFSATHPITLSADTMARVLRGVVVQQNRDLLGGLILGKPEATRVFRDEDVQFLTPLLIEALSRAASDQKVAFRVVQIGAPWESITASIYAYERSLYLTIPWLIPLSRYQDGGPAAPPTILFFPASAKHPYNHRDERPAETTLIIDYALVAALPPDLGAPPPGQVPTGAPPVSAGQSTAPVPATQTIQSPPQPTEREWEDMRKELQSLKRQLTELEAERNAQKENGSSKQKTPVIP